MGIGAATYSSSSDSGLGITAHPYQQTGQSHYHDESVEEDSFNDSRDMNQDVSQDLEDVELMQEQHATSSSSYIPSTLFGNPSRRLSSQKDRMVPSSSPSPSKRKAHHVKKASNSKSRRVKTSHRQYKPNSITTTSARSNDVYVPPQPQQSISQGGPFSIPPTKPLPHLHNLPPRISTSSEALLQNESLALEEVVEPPQEPSTTRSNPDIAGHKRLTLFGSNEILEPPSSTRSDPVPATTTHANKRQKQRFSEGDTMDFEWVGGVPKCKGKKNGLFSRVKRKVKVLMGSQKSRVVVSPTRVEEPIPNASSRRDSMQESSSALFEQHAQEESVVLTSSVWNQNNGPDQFQLRGLGKLPTILDESYQSTVNESFQGHAIPHNSSRNVATDNNIPLDTTRMLDDLEESSYDRSDNDQSNDIDVFAQLLGLGDHEEQDEDYSMHAESMDASRDYSVVTEEVDDLKPTFSSCHKPPLDRLPLSQTIEEEESDVDNTYSNSYLNDLLDKAHASYVEGQRDSKDEIKTPDVQLRLGHLFADVTMNQSRSRYHHLETPEHETPSVFEKDKDFINMQGQTDNNAVGMTELLEESCDEEDAPHILLKDCQGAPTNESFFIKIPEEGGGDNKDRDDSEEEELGCHPKEGASVESGYRDGEEENDGPERDTAENEETSKIKYPRCPTLKTSVEKTEKELNPLSNEDTSKPVNIPNVDLSPENKLNELSSSTTPVLLISKPKEGESKERKLTPMFLDKRDDVFVQKLTSTNLLPDMQSDEDSYAEELNLLANTIDESQLAETKSEFLSVSSSYFNLLIVQLLIVISSRTDLAKIIEEKRNLEIMISNMRKELKLEKMEENIRPIESKKNEGSRGPKLGTIIQVRTKTVVTNKEESKLAIHVVENRIVESNDSNSVQSEISAKAAFTNEALANASFLFSSKPVRLNRKSQPTSRIDRERLSLITIQDYRDNVHSFHPQKVSGLDALKPVSIQDFRDRVLSPQSQQVDAHSESLKHVLDPNTNTTDQEDNSLKDLNLISDAPDETSVNDDHNSEDKDSFVSNDTTSLLSPTYDFDELDQEEEEEVAESKVSSEECHDVELSQTLSQSLLSQGAEVQSQSSQPRDSLAEILDGSPTSIHSKRYSAITPFKTLSPHKRFKNALKRFGKSSPNHECEDKVEAFSEAKTQPEKKKSFVLNRVTEWNGQLRRNMPRSLKKVRRMTSGEDVIAPRKPTLVNPYFRKNNFQNDDENIEETMDLNVDIVELEEESGELHEVSSASSPSDKNIKEKTGTASDIDDSSSSSKASIETNSITVPSPSTESSTVTECYSQNRNKQKSWPDDETDELTIPESPVEQAVEQAIDDETSMTEHISLNSEGISEKSTQEASLYEAFSDSPDSSDSSNNSSVSEEDVFANLIRAALSDDDSEASSYRKSSVSKNLMSAMKKRSTGDNENQVRWSAVETTVMNSLDCQGQEKETYSQNENLSHATEDIYAMPKQPPLSRTFNASVNPKAFNNKGSKSAFAVYSPAGESLCSVSPKLGNFEDDKENRLVYYSPSGSTLCSYSPLPPMSQTTDSGINSTVKATPKSPSALCLSPLQRTPLQARKWRTLAAQAEANKGTTNSKKKRFGKKRTPLRMIQ